LFLELLAFPFHFGIVLVLFSCAALGSNSSIEGLLILLKVNGYLFFNKEDSVDG